MRLKRRRVGIGTFANSLPFLLLAIIIGNCRIADGQEQVGQRPIDEVVTDSAPTDLSQQEQQEPLPTGKWNQFKGFYTPRPLPSDAHFTFASVWASWSAWSYCTNNIQMRVRACNTVRGFSCLGPNREVLPCENSMPSGPKRSRQFQVPINANPHAHFADPHNPPQYEAEDPWADDRREALKQLSADYVEPQKAEKSQELNELKKMENRQIPAVVLPQPIQVFPAHQEMGRPPSTRPELFSSKTVVKNGHQQMPDNLEEMDMIMELANTLELKPTGMPLKKSMEEEEEDEIVPTLIPGMPESTSPTSTTILTTAALKMPTKAADRREYLNKFANDATAQMGLAQSLAFTTSSPIPFRTTKILPKYRPEHFRNRPKEQLNARERTILAVMEKQRQRNFRRSGEIGERREEVDKSTKSSGADGPISTQVDDDTSRALEWMMANMSKSIELAQHPQQKGKMPSGSQSAEEEAEEAPHKNMEILHSGESILDDSSPLREQQRGHKKVPKMTKRGRAMAAASFQMTKNEGGERVAEINGQKQQNMGSEGNQQTTDIQLKHRQRLISKLSKAHQAKQRQLEKSREQIQKVRGAEAKSAAQMENQLERLRAEMSAMEAVLARMKLDTMNEKKEETRAENVDEKEGFEEPNREVPENILPKRVEVEQQPKENRRELMVEQKPAEIVFPSKEQKRKIADATDGGMKENEPNTEIHARILPARFPSPRSTTAFIRMPPFMTATTTSASLIMTEEPESIWLAGSAPRAGDAQWSGWSQWGQCICGKQMRSRTCLFEDNNTFHSKGCVGQSYESRQCSTEGQNCPTTIAPIPPSKRLAVAATAQSQRREGGEGEGESAEEVSATVAPTMLNHRPLRRTALSHHHFAQQQHQPTIINGRSENNTNGMRWARMLMMRRLL